MVPNLKYRLGWRLWRGVVGGLIVLSQVRVFAAQAPAIFKAKDPWEKVGMAVGYAIVAVFGIWLFSSGFPKKQRQPG